MRTSTTPLLTVGLAAVLVGLTVTAQEPPATRPRAVYSVGTAFDGTRGKLVVFGGFGRGGYVSDTWEWDGAA